MSSLLLPLMASPPPLTRATQLVPVALAGLLACSTAPSDLGASGGAPSASGGTIASGGSIQASGGLGALVGGSPSGGRNGTSGGATSSGGSTSSGGATSSGGSTSSGSAQGTAGGGANAGGQGSGGSSGGGTGGSTSGPHTLITIGDSITQSTCWRALVWQALDPSDKGRFDFVGSQKNDSACAPSSYDKDTESYGSSLLTQAISGSFTNPSKTCSPKAASTGNCPALVDFTNAFTKYKADVAFIHYGTNDVWENKDKNAIVDGYSQLVDGLRAANSHVHVFVAQIIPLASSQCSSCATTVPALNAAIAAWAPTKSTADSPIHVVDQFTGFDSTSDTKDGVHPNDAGSKKMADKWLAALKAADL